MTSRELAEAIDQLIVLRVEHDFIATKDLPAHADAIEACKRLIADGFKRLDHNPGVYVGDPPIK